jgi:hypothetical protein
MRQLVIRTQRQPRRRHFRDQRKTLRRYTFVLASLRLRNKLRRYKYVLASMRNTLRRYKYVFASLRNTLRRYKYVHTSVAARFIAHLNAQLPINCRQKKPTHLRGSV